MKTSLSYKVARLARSAGYNFKSHDDADVQNMRQEIAALDGNGVNFSISIERDGSWYAEATNVEGLLTGGNNVHEIDAMLRDAIFTYYGVAPQHCDDSLLRSSGDVKIIKQQVHVTA